ncbi:SDR family oxidoreductase, partial [Acinetobacter baumannii]
GIANENSIAYGCARACRALGADLALTYLNQKAHGYVAPLAEALGATMLEPLDVRDMAQQAALFERIARDWGRLDFLIHSIAFAPKED